jgi:starch synthase
MRVLQISAEIYPLLKTGGLADVAAALPGALGRAGCDVRALLPGFAVLRDALADSRPVGQVAAPWGDVATVRRGRIEVLSLDAYVVDAPSLYDRPGGGPYQDAAGQPWPDNHRRFALLGQAGASLAQGLDPQWQPRILHSHDWHAAAANAYLAFARRRRPLPVGSVYTIHNLAYQGLFAGHHFHELGLPAEAFGIGGVEFHGQVSFMKAGLSYADRLTTVSPTYAREIQSTQQGCGLDGLLRERAAVLSGILNGVDDAVWNPATDVLLPHTYSAGDLAGKARCKAALQSELGLASSASAPMFGMVTRLAEQKGLPLVLAALPDIVERGGQFVLLGSGDATYEAACRAAAAAHPEAVAVRIGYDEAFAHRVFGASDVTLVPSRYEPCGLTQMYGLRYGSLPLVRRVGGLADTVVDCSLEEMAEGRATGFVFERFDADDMRRAVRRAFALHGRPGDWAAVRACAMSQRFDWDAAAAEYVALYRRLTS